VASFEDKFLKKNFMDPGTLTPMACRKSKVLQLAKKPKQDGKSIAEACIFDGPQGWSYTYSAAKAVADQSDRGASDYGEFNCPFGRYHGHIRIDAFDVAQGQTNRGAYLRQIGEALTNSVKTFGSIAARKVLGPVGGHIARITAVNAGGSNGEMTLTVRGDCLNITPGMILMAADGTGDGAPSNVRAGLGYVIGVMPDGFADGSQVKVATSEALRQAGTVGLPSGWANSDYLFRNGDVQASTDLSDRQIRSLQGFIRITPGEAEYLGVNLAQDARLSGNRLPAATVNGLSITDRCLLLISECNASSSAEEIDHVAMGPRTYQQLLDEARTYGRLEMGETKLGVSGVKLQTVIGEVVAIGDSHVRESDIWAITSDSLRIYNSDGFPALDVLGGGQILKSEGSAGYFVRYHAFSSVTVNGRPWDFGRCDSGNT
jgi:hypothetical protein